MNAKIDTQRVQHILTSTVMMAALMSPLAACGGSGGGLDSAASLPGTNNPSTPGDSGNPSEPNNPTTNPVITGLLQTTLGNTGKAVDNTLPLNLDSTLGGVGQALDPTIQPVVDTATGLTQQVGAITGLGQPADGAIKQVGGLVEGLGATVTGTSLPGGLSAGVGGLVENLGKTVSSTGGLLNADPKNPQPLTSVLGNATNAVGALTASLSGPGGLLNPVNQLVGGVTGDVLGGPSKPLLEPALGNVGKTVDNVLPLGLQPTLDGLGKALDPTASPLTNTVLGLTQQVGATTKLGTPVAGLLNSLGGTISNLDTQLPGSNVAGLNSVLQGLGGAVSNAGGLLNAAPSNPNPLGATLTNATDAVASLTNGLGLGSAVGGNNGGLLSPITGTLGGGTGGNSGLLAPVTGLLGGVTGNLGNTTGGTANSGLLGGLLGGVSGVSGGAGGTAGTNGGLLGGLTGGNASAGVSAGASTGASNSASNGGLLGGLLGGVTADVSGNASTGANNGGLLGGLLGGLSTKK